MGQWGNEAMRQWGNANALTVDVEEWFHVCGAGPGLDPEGWPHLPARVVANTRELLALFDRAGVTYRQYVPENALKLEKQ